MAQDPLQAALAVLDEPEAQDPLEAALAVLDEPEEPAPPARAIGPIGGGEVERSFKTKPDIAGPTARRHSLRGGGGITASEPQFATEVEHSLVRGAGRTAIGAVQGGGLAAEGLEKLNRWMLSKFLGPEVLQAPREPGMGAKVAAAGEKAKEMLPERSSDPRVQGFLTQDVPEGVGSALAFAAGGALSGGGTAAVAAAGALTGFADGYYDALARDGTEEEAWTSALANAGLGLTEAVPIGAQLARLNRGTGGSLATGLRRMLLEGFTETLQEGVQGAGGNLIAQALYDEDRGAWDGVVRGGATGFVVGALLSAGASSAGQALARQKAAERAQGPQQPNAWSELAPAEQGAAAGPKAAATAPGAPVKQGVGASASEGVSEAAASGPLPSQPAAMAESGAPVTLTVPEGALRGAGGEYEVEVVSIDGDDARVRDPETGAERTVPAEWLQAAEAPSTEPEGPSSLPAAMPTDAGLFGQVERETAGPAGPAVGEAAAPTSPMFDEQPGDLPGQGSLLDVAEATPKSDFQVKAEAARARSDRAKERIEGAKSGMRNEGTLRDFIAAEGGLRFSPEAWMRFSKKETGDKSKVGIRFPVRPEGKGGMNVQQAATAAINAGYLPGWDYRDVTLDDLLEAMESDVPHLDAIEVWVAKQAEDEARRFEEAFGSPEEAAQAAERTTSIKNAKMDELALEMGLEPATSAERTTFEAENEAAASRLKADPFAGQSLLADVRNKDRAITGEEAALLTREVNRLRLLRDQVERQIIEEGELGNADEVERLEEQAGKILDEFDFAKGVLRRTGTQTARGLAFRRMEIAEDYSLVAMERAKRAANHGAPLTPDQSNEIRDLHKRIAEAQAKHDAEQAKTDERLEALQAQIDLLIKAHAPSDKPQRARRQKATPGPVRTFIKGEADKARARIKARGTQLSAGFDPLQWADHIIVGVDYIAQDIADLTAWSKAMLAEFGDAIEPYLQDIHAQSERAAATMAAQSGVEERKAKVRAASEGEKGMLGAAGDVRKLAEAFVASGVTEREALIDAVHAVLTEIDPTLARRETMDLVSGYGDFKPLSREATKVRLRELRGEMQQIAKIEDMVERGQLPRKTGPERRTPSEVERKLIREVNETKKRLNLKGDDATHLRSALRAYKTRVENEVKRLKERIAAGDFAPRPKPKPLDLDSEAIKAQAELESVKQEFLRGLDRDRRKRQTPRQKATMIAKDVLNIPRVIWSSYDLSALGRQGKWAAFSHPAMAARALKLSLRAMASEKTHQQIDVSLRQRAKPGLYLADLDAKLSAREEAIRSNLAESIPVIGRGLRASNRAFVTLLNVMRVKMYDAMLASVHAAPNSERARTVAEYVNIATGRGEMGKFAGAADAAAYVLWSPRLYVSRLQILSGYPLWKKGVDPVARKLIAKEFARSIVGMIAYYSALKLFVQSLIADDDEEVVIEDDPRSSDFGKVRVGNTRIDPMGGMLQFAVLAARYAAGDKVTLGGDERSLTHYQVDGEDPVGYGQDDIASVVGNFVRGKLNPTLSLALDLRSGENVVGEPVPRIDEEPLKLAAKLLSPLSVQNIIEAVEEHGVTRGAALSALALLGEGVQVYEDREAKAKESK